MKLGDLIKQQGIEPPRAKEDLKQSPTPPRRRYFWDDDQAKPADELETKSAEQPVSSPLEAELKKHESVSQALDSREFDESPPLEKPVVSRKTGVSSPLGKNRKKTEPVSQASPTPLDIRELAVRKTENSPLDIGLLVGKEKTLVLLAFDECRKIGSLETNYVQTEDLKIRLSIDSNGLRNLIHRVKEKGFFEVEAKQLGRNGLRKFKISQTIYQQFLNSPLDSRELGVSSALAQPLGKPLDDAPCSSSSLNSNSKETTTDEPIWLNVPEKIQGQVPVNQLRAMVKNGTIDQETMEDSLWGFAHDLEKGLVKSKTGNVIGLFIGALKNGGYISQQYLAQKQKETQELRERVEEIKTLRQELGSNRLAEEFENFRKEFPDEAEAMKPSNAYIKNFEQGGVGYKMWLEEFRLKTSKSGNA